ncbi:hypothetical protein [Lysinibacillus pakistanensis]|uniref:hypothetical protein n=1 Tax=Lysinibacillus pakistanensis TaxID=759811 RepID=UPI003D2AF9F0
MAEEIIEEVPTVPAVEVVDLTGLEEKLTGLVEVLEAEQEQKKLEAEELARQEEQAKLEAEEQAKIDAQTQKVVEEQQQADVATVEEFRENVLAELKTLNENVQHYEILVESIVEHQKVEMELYNTVYFASIAVILVVCVMPSIWIARALKNMIKSFI